jgi:nucleotide-binding universal stress UspA family protein
MKLLIPTDFSDVSKNSIIYGFHLADELNLQVQLVHVLELYKFAAGTSEAELISTILPSDNIKEMEASATESFKKLIEEIRANYPFKSSYELRVVSGHLINEIIIESAQEEIALMILAVSSNQDLISRFTNNTISAIITDSICPILIIPSGFAYKVPSKVTLATDFNKADLDILNKFLSFFRNQNPELEVLHIAQKNNDFKTELKFAGFKQLVTEKIDYKNVKFKMVSYKNVVKGILEELKSDNSDMLLMLKEHESFFKSLFETSKTEKITHYLKIPMISFNQAGTSVSKRSK